MMSTTLCYDGFKYFLYDLVLKPYSEQINHSSYESVTATI